MNRKQGEKAAETYLEFTTCTFTRAEFAALLQQNVCSKDMNRWVMFFFGSLFIAECLGQTQNFSLCFLQYLGVHMHVKKD